MVQNATLLTAVSWHYAKIPQLEFAKLQASDFSDIVMAFGIQA